MHKCTGDLGPRVISVNERHYEQFDFIVVKNLRMVTCAILKRVIRWRIETGMTRSNCLTREDTRVDVRLGWGFISVLRLDVDAAKASLENVPANLYESVCVPDLGDFLGYQGGGHQVATPDKNPPTPANSATSNSSGPPQSGTQQQPPIQPSSGAVSLPSRQYHNDGKSTFTIPLRLPPPRRILGLT